MTKPDELPPWLFAHVQKCRDAFGIGGDWPVCIDLRDEVDGDPDTNGLTTTNHRYMTARVELRRDLDPAADGVKTVTHELLHAAQWQQLGAVWRILDLVPKKLRTHAEDLWRDGNERYIEQLARALTPLLQALDHPPTEDTDADD